MIQQRRVIILFAPLTDQCIPDCFSRGRSAFPKLRFVSLVENGTHVLFGTGMGGYKTGEITLAKKVLISLCKGMLCLADRNFYDFELWKQASGTDADLLGRIKGNIGLPCENRLPDGSCLSRVYASQKDQCHKKNGALVRVIEYRLGDVRERAKTIHLHIENHIVVIK